MDSYLEISNILFDNRESLLDNDYLKLMNMIKCDYENNTLLFTSYIIDNTTSLDEQVTLDLLVIILKNLKELILKEKKEEINIKSYTKIMPVILFFSQIFSILN